MKRAHKAIRYEIHAIRRMAQRGVSEQQIREAVRHPSAVRSAKRYGAKRFEKVISRRRRLCVIAEERELEFWIVSAWWM